MIKVGDRVTVYFDRVEAEYNVEVISIPMKPFDSWVFKRMDGKIVNVQQYQKMVGSEPIASKPKPNYVAVPDPKATIESKLTANAMAAVSAGEEIWKGDKKA